MALFSKPPAKKPASGSAKVSVAPKVRQPPASARELASRAATMPGAKARLEPVPAGEPTTGTSLIEWTPQPQAIEVAQANPGLCAVLENAALLYASGQAPAARTLLEEGVNNDHDARQSPLAWLALFDLLQRAGEREAFDRIALQYSVQFERSAPMWEGRSNATTAPRGGGYLTITGALTEASAAQVDSIRRAIAKWSSGARLDLSSLGTFDDAGARLLADALADARRAKLALTIERSQNLQTALDAAVRSGVDGGEGAWLLALEMLQWTRDQATFDERAIEYAVTFEMSPPSWEPPALPADEASASKTPEPRVTDADALALSGVLAGSGAPAIAEVQQFAHGRRLVAIDMTAVERIDFVGAGTLSNAVNRIESQRKAVQVLGASPIIRALLLLIGLSPRHFVKKAV